MELANISENGFGSYVIGGNGETDSLTGPCGNNRFIGSYAEICLVLFQSACGSEIVGFAVDLGDALCGGAVGIEIICIAL